MKLLFAITRSDTVGGAQLHVRDLAQQANQQGHKVVVVTGEKGIYNKTLTEAGIESIACPTFKNNINPAQDGQTLFFLRKTILDFEPDLVATHSSKAGILGRLASRMVGVPCTFTAHGWSFTDGIAEPKRTIYQGLEFLTARITDKIICVSEYDRQLAIKAGIDPSKLVRIHYGVRDIPSEDLAQPGSEDPVRIVMIARFEPQKDHRTMLAALKEVPGAKLDFLGDGPQMEEMKVLAQKLGVSERVNFLGFCDNVAERLPEYQIFALITNWEGFPISTLEAMRAGLPTVVSDVCGSSEAIIEGETGYSIPRGDVATLRDRLNLLVSDPQLRERMGKAARERYEKEYTFELMFERTLNVYRQVLSNSHQQ